MTVTDRTDATEQEFRSRIAAFESAPTPPEVREAAVLEEVARAIVDEALPDFPFTALADDELARYRRLAVAAVAAYRATQDGGAEEAVRRVEKVVRCGRGYTDAEHWVDGHYACPGFASPAIAPQAGDGAR